jgi:hypothetical protein
MKAILALALLLAVTISVMQDVRPGACVLRSPTTVNVVKQANGKYKRIEVPGKVTIVDCPAIETLEEWTAPPESGGTFLRRVRDVNR